MWPKKLLNYYFKIYNINNVKYAVLQKNLVPVSEYITTSYKIMEKLYILPGYAIPPKSDDDQNVDDFTIYIRALDGKEVAIREGIDSVRKSNPNQLTIVHTKGIIEQKSCDTPRGGGARKYSFKGKEFKTIAKGKTAFVMMTMNQVRKYEAQYKITAKEAEYAFGRKRKMVNKSGHVYALIPLKTLESLRTSSKR